MSDFILIDVFLILGLFGFGFLLVGFLFALFGKDRVSHIFFALLVLTMIAIISVLFFYMLSILGFF